MRSIPGSGDAQFKVNLAQYQASYTVNHQTPKGFVIILINAKKERQLLISSLKH